MSKRIAVMVPAIVLIAVAAWSQDSRVVPGYTVHVPPRVEYGRLGPELDEYGQPVLHYVPNPWVVAEKARRAEAYKEMKAQGRSHAEWQVHDRIVKATKVVVDASLDKRLKPGKTVFKSDGVTITVEY